MTDWKAYTPASTSRVRESVEWSITYGYNTEATALPRVLLIGDSICNAYQYRVCELLAGRVTVSFWASSKCVTDPDYFKELCYILDARPYAMVCFNNALHSLTTDRAEWKAAYASAVRCIRNTLPDAALSIVSPTPLREPEPAAQAAELDGLIRTFAAEEGLPLIDLYALMDPLDRNEYWNDTYHFRPAGVEMQARLIAAHVLERLGLSGGAL